MQASIIFKTITAYTQQPPTTSLPSSGSKSGVKAVRPGTIKAGTLTLEDAMNVLLHGYVKGGSGGSGKCQSTIAPITVKSERKSSQSFSVKMTTRFAILFIGTILNYFMFDFTFAKTVFQGFLMLLEWMISMRLHNDVNDFSLSIVKSSLNRFFDKRHWLLCSSCKSH